MTILAALALSGCAIHYYDPESGTEHLYGFGHMRMRVSEPVEGVRATVKSTEVLGASIGVSKDDRHIVAGWNRRTRLDAIDENTSVRFEWPTSDLFDVRVGSDPPFLKKPTEDRVSKMKETGEEK